jgi:hypothetical protein
VLTNYGENQLVDCLRGEGLDALPGSWSLALVSAASDSAFTELSGTGYARQSVARSLAAWAGTQGVGTTLASTGTSHKSSNNDEIDWGTAGSAWGTAVGVVFLDTDSPAAAWMFIPFAAPVAISTDDPVSIAPGGLGITVGLAGGMSNYLANKLVDWIFRGQAYSWPVTLHVGYANTAPTNAGGGNEPAGSYARQPIASSLAAWDNTQGDRTTDPSTGTSGHTSNNAAVSFPVPTIDQGAVGWVQVFDAATVGNLMWWRALASPKSFTTGGAAPQFAVGALEITFS